MQLLILSVVPLLPDHYGEGQLLARRALAMLVAAFHMLIVELLHRVLNEAEHIVFRDGLVECERLDLLALESAEELSRAAR